MKTELYKALNILKSGGIILYPTDTIWGIGCDATNSKVVEKIYKIKKREESKALISLVSDAKLLEKYTNFQIKETNNKQATTIIYPNTIGLASNLLGENHSAAIRIVKDDFCKELIQQFGKAIVSTSANISGTKFPEKFLEISDEIKKNVDYIVNLRQNEIMSKPSALLMINKNGKIKRIR
tara:strand:+ start:485 stop:1027 length:543 start_codon:yes stop_codon:yes gene_type:complete